jgi:small subunit ribosomal protein S16
MLVIRLARQGRTKYPVYRIVAADQRRAATSKFVSILGHYNPHTKEIVLKKDEIEKYLNNGAQASDRVLRLLKAEGVKLPSWAKTHDRNKAAKKVEEENNDKTAESDVSTTKDTTNETEESKPVDGTETANSAAEAVEPKAEDQKVDVGTIKEAEDKKSEAEAQDKAANVAVDEATKEKAE